MCRRSSSARSCTAPLWRLTSCERAKARVDPLTRPAERVQADVRKGLVRRAKAERDYGVVLDDVLNIDEAATAQLREQLANERGEVLPFDFGPSLDSLLANAADETGLQAPRQPQLVKWASARAKRRGAHAVAATNGHAARDVTAASKVVAAD